MRDIIVIGAGPAGSSLAHALARRGWDVLLVERDTFPRHKVCGEFLSPESQASLSALGLLDTVAGLAPTTMRAATLTAASGRSLRVALPGDAWGVSRFALDAALARAAETAGATLRTATYALEMEVSEVGARVRLRAGGEMRVEHARAAVVACGRHPARGLRARPPRAAHKTGVGVKCHIAGIAARPEVELYLFEGGYAGLAPVGGGLVNLCLLVSREAFRRAGGDPRAVIAALGRWNPALGERLAGGQIVSETLVSVAPVDTGDEPAPWHGAARLGDAAAMIPPLCGDGMAMALRAAELCAPLADALLGGRITLGAWEAAYRSAWRREFGPRLRAARVLQAALVRPPLAELCLRAGALVPPLARAVVHATRGRPGAAPYSF
nr:MAG: monooxygenase [Chloroflexota bacterium]